MITWTSCLRLLLKQEQKALAVQSQPRRSVPSTAKGTSYLKLSPNLTNLSRKSVRSYRQCLCLITWTKMKRKLQSMLWMCALWPLELRWSKKVMRATAVTLLATVPWPAPKCSPHQTQVAKNRSSLGLTRLEISSLNWHYCTTRSVERPLLQMRNVNFLSQIGVPLIILLRTPLLKRGMNTKNSSRKQNFSRLLSPMNVANYLKVSNL